jgi:glutamyl-tRNA reductase
MSYRTAPVTLLERASIGPGEVPKTLHELLRGGHVAEALVLSTCNRVELYADVDRFHAGMHDISSALARRAGVEVPELGEHLYVHYDDAAVAHLFSVAAGLDSMVAGESQILGQLRSAYALATEQDAAARSLHEICQQALRVGKRVRTETGIGRAGASLVSVAVAEAEHALGPAPGAGPAAGHPLAGRRALVVGTGSIGSLAATTLARAGIGELALANRTAGRAERLAASLQATMPTYAIEMDDLDAELVRADVVVACTGAVGQIVSYDAVEAAVQARAGRPLVLIDLAVPRDVDPATGTLPGVRYLDVTALREPAQAGTVLADIAQARSIVAEEVAGYLANQRATAVAPTVAALRARAAEVVEAELARLDGRLPRLDPAVRAELTHAMHRVVQTLLHAPTVRVKEMAEQPGGDAYAAVLRELFGLDPAGPAAVTSVGPNAELSVSRPIAAREEW